MILRLIISVHKISDSCYDDYGSVHLRKLDVVLITQTWVRKANVRLEHTYTHTCTYGLWLSLKKAFALLQIPLIKVAIGWKYVSRSDRTRTIRREGMNISNVQVEQGRWVDLSLPRKSMRIRWADKEWVEQLIEMKKISIGLGTMRPSSQTNTEMENGSARLGCTTMKAKEFQNH